MKNKKMIALTLAGALTFWGFVAKGASAEPYTIQSGDTLYSISQQFNTTIASIMEVNHLKSDLIYADDTIEIGLDTELYLIEPGDTLFRIAADHNVSVEQLQEWNDLSSDLIYAGDTISVSGSTEEVLAVIADQSSDADSNATETDSSDRVETIEETSAPTSNVERTMTVEATAYTAYCDGCSGTTANGTNLRANPNLKVIAVDPRVIPLGTKVWVEGYGEAVAADTGGAIKGNKIDVFIPNLDGAYEWGRRTVTIKILD
ncbi:LysM peptidoglycan-binding and 3D domain-containing protein [Solibacillus daqui]|uniref:LysM peptidoglycan-binding and 3D domain-containing protein n=1 Tax=Solibacillus daqui TaxID=2912187 RepID=UPI0023661F35|nr:LysM peptidoglycan-binding and 3D domain-containing protein [Solibacillus daqui]